MPPNTPSKFHLARKILDGKVQIYTQNTGPMFYVRHYVQGGYGTTRTMTTDIREARSFAENWFYELQSRIRAGEPIHEPKFSALVTEFLNDPKIKTEVSEAHFKNHHKKWKLLEPYCRNPRVSEITSEFLVQATTQARGTEEPLREATKWEHRLK